MAHFRFFAIGANLAIDLNIMKIVQNPIVLVGMNLFSFHLMDVPTVAQI